MNFRELNNQLIKAGAGSRAAECHGFLCGYLCISTHVDEAAFKQYLFADTMAGESMPDLGTMVSALASEVHSDLNSEDFNLRLMLPDEDRPLSERGEAFIQWCESFLSGMGVGGLGELDLLSPESREVIEDIYKICRLDLESMAGNGDDEEKAFTELTEYVRMGAMLLHEELHQTGDENGSPEVLH